MVKTKPKKTPLTIQKIASCALELADKEGLEQVSMRKIASALGVEAMSLYYHLPSKAHLMQAMVEQLAQEIRISGSDSPWRDSLTQAARQWRNLACNHPGAFPLVATRAQTSSIFADGYASLLSTLVNAGLTPENAATSLSSFFYGLNGYLLAAGEPMAFADIPEPSATSVLAASTQSAAILAAIPESVWKLSLEKTFDRHVEFLLRSIECVFLKDNES